MRAKLAEWSDSSVQEDETAEPLAGRPGERQAAFSTPCRVRRPSLLVWRGWVGTPKVVGGHT